MVMFAISQAWLELAVLQLWLVSDRAEADVHIHSNSEDALTSIGGGSKAAMRANASAFVKQKESCLGSASSLQEILR